MRMALAIASIGAALFAVSATSASTRPLLHVVDHAPLTIRGDGFARGERVTVTVLTGLGPRRASVVATGGVFRVTFRVPAGGCAAAFAARARGDAGSAASLVLDGAPTCVPPPIR